MIGPSVARIRPRGRLASLPKRRNGRARRRAVRKPGRLAGTDGSPAKPKGYDLGARLGDSAGGVREPKASTTSHANR